MKLYPSRFVCKCHSSPPGVRVSHASVPWDIFMLCTNMYSMCVNHAASKKQKTKTKAVHIQLRDNCAPTHRHTHKWRTDKIVA